MRRIAKPTCCCTMIMNKKHVMTSGRDEKHNSQHAMKPIFQSVPKETHSSWDIYNVKMQSFDVNQISKTLAS